MNKHFLITLKRMNTLIKMRATGCPSCFASKLGIAESTLYKYINVLKEDFGAPIVYDSYSESYHFEMIGEIQFGFKPLTEREATLIEGGHRLYNFSQLYAA